VCEALLSLSPTQALLKNFFASRSYSSVSSLRRLLKKIVMSLYAKGAIASRRSSYTRAKKIAAHASYH
jgi:hypothetical protein